MDEFVYLAEEMDEEEEIEEDVVARAPKRYVRDAQNPFEYFSEEEFRRRYRFTKDSVQNYILPKLEEHLVKENRRGLPIEPVFQVLLALRFYATASFQILLGDVGAVSQATASRVVTRISHLLALQLMHFIKMPGTAHEQAATMEQFADLQKRHGHPEDHVIPNILGAIDCTHVRLTSTKLNQVGEVYRNRKGYFSLNVQAVVGPQMQIQDLVQNYPGSYHDSRIFQNSRICHRFRTGELPGALLGDSGYASRPYMFTPFLDPQTRPQVWYNRAQKKARNVVERTFGVLKRRFPCLSRGLTNKLETTTSIVAAVAVLHNMSLIVNDRWHEEAEDPIEDEVPALNIVDLPADGLAARLEVVRLYFQE